MSRYPDVEAQFNSRREVVLLRGNTLLASLEREQAIALLAQLAQAIRNTQPEA
jgi:hypothetical protein